MSARTAIAAAIVALLLPATAGAQPGVSVESGIGNDQATAVTPLARPVDRGNSTDTLLVLERLHSYGYTINSEARAARAIRHWQRANGLSVDGVAGPETLASLRLTATAAAPAVRTTPPPAPALPVAEPPTVEQIIRDVWPDELEDRALRIAYRESRFQPGAINANHDATGLFQVMWSVHRRWLCPQMGVCAQTQLLDADTNARAAYALYQRADEANGDTADGWTPWRTS